MGIELDSLKKMEATVIVNNTTGEIINFYAGDDLIKKLKEIGIEKNEIFKFLDEDEVFEFFIDFNMDLEGLEELMEVKK